MRVTLQIIGIILLINGIGGLVKDDFGLLANVADGGALTGLQVVAILGGAALAGGSSLRRMFEESDDAW
ncbi:hypothetical protein [Hoyosella altamirensis]|uniref:Putative membrane protein n=1 Tax=Hoyosella altamirensis TaxID=616997 RepID=A0A839RPH4_9ACTN|nr:hypothetical protein [Hoyosella altamirensis]MBB3037893.1 putative membrane protein [Hoyosella altamirensis]